MSVVTLETSNNTKKWICRNAVIFTWVIKQWLILTILIMLAFCHTQKIMINIFLPTHTPKTSDWHIALQKVMDIAPYLTQSEQASKQVDPSFLPSDRYFSVFWVVI